MKKGLQRIAVLLLGLLLAQCIATLQVYSSNVDLHRTLHMLKEAGYLIVPNQQISPAFSVSTLPFGEVFSSPLALEFF